jgi:hypothetical protein
MKINIASKLKSDIEKNLFKSIRKVQSVWIFLILLDKNILVIFCFSLYRINVLVTREKEQV